MKTNNNSGIKRTVTVSFRDFLESESALEAYLKYYVNTNEEVIARHPKQWVSSLLSWNKAGFGPKFWSKLDKKWRAKCKNNSSIIKKPLFDIHESKGVHKKALREFFELIKS